MPVMHSPLPCMPYGLHLRLGLELRLILKNASVDVHALVYGYNLEYLGLMWLKLYDS